MSTETRTSFHLATSKLPLRGEHYLVQILSMSQKTTNLIQGNETITTAMEGSDSLVTHLQDKSELFSTISSMIQLALPLTLALILILLFSNPKIFLYILRVLEGKSHWRTAWTSDQPSETTSTHQPTMQIHK